MTPWAWKWWRIARSQSADGTLLVDASGEWIRLWGKTWWLAEKRR